MSASEPSPGGEIKGQNVSERREQFTPGSEEGKAAVSMYTCGALMLLPPSAEGRQDPTPSPCFTCLKFLPLGSALPSSGASVLMPTPSSTRHSCSQPLPPSPPPREECFQNLPREGTTGGCKRGVTGAGRSRAEEKQTSPLLAVCSTQPSSNSTKCQWF